MLVDVRNARRGTQHYLEINNNANETGDAYSYHHWRVHQLESKICLRLTMKNILLYVNEQDNNF